MDSACVDVRDSRPAEEEQESKAIRVIVADDHAIFRESLAALLALHPSIQVVGKAADGQQALELAQHLRPDVLLLDMMMPHKSGLEVLRDLRSMKLQVLAIVLSGAIGKSETLQALQLGARGVVQKAESTESLVQGIARVANGGYWLGRQGMDSLIEAVSQGGASTGERLRFGLTRREFQIVQAVLEGCSNSAIAETFRLSEQTVKHHLSHIFDKLGVYSRLELALFAVNHKLDE